MHVVPFQSDHFSIRAVEIDGEPWFVGKDIAEALGYKDTEAMTRRLDEDEKQNLQIVGFGNRGTTLISEPGLYTAILGSSKDEAKVFKKWVTSEVLPAIRKTGRYQVKRAKIAKPPTPLKQLSEASKAFKDIYQLLRVLDFDKNAATISANQAVRQQGELDLLALTGNTHLKAENQNSLHYTPTELGQQLGGLSAVKVNKLLEQAGLQSKAAGYWLPTPNGRPHAFISDTGKQHSNGAPVQQVRWFDRVLPLIDSTFPQRLAA